MVAFGAATAWHRRKMKRAPKTCGLLSKRETKLERREGRKDSPLDANW
jgi:hypothetical protein